MSFDVFDKGTPAMGGKALRKQVTIYFSADKNGPREDMVIYVPANATLELKVGGTVKAMIESDLALEVAAVKQYNDAVAIAMTEGDNGSRDLLVRLLKDEEDHVDFLEAQMHQIKELGYERYLTMQMGDQEEE